ncbi:L,D-transpeptidase, partial [Dermabacteraceae bacterium TAE3-ERU5]|nr:L,D-transpeptidase [Dermabacteraceae bacterium TAE3-ERU5]
VAYWHRGYAFPGAPWRGCLGYSGEQGSHGCVNLPVSEAKWIYDWAPIGTPVVSHAGR